MDLDFLQGSSKTPRGHALLFFRNAADNAEVVATYIVVLPISIDLAKYVPPMMAARLPFGSISGISAVPLPPVPEKVAGIPELERLAATRGDDLIDGGTLDLTNFERALTQSAESAQRYAELYAGYQATQPTAPAVADATPAEESGVNDVLYGLMSEQQKLTELTKLVGQLRYAVEGSDASQSAETVREMERLARHLPEKFTLGDLIAAAQQPGPRGQRLAELYMTRCYKISAEDYLALDQINTDIKSLLET